MSSPSSILRMVRGDDYEFDVFVTDSASGDAEDLTGTELWFTAKRTYYEADGVAPITKEIGDGITVLDAAGGQARVLIEAADTEDFTQREVLRFDVQWRDSNALLHTIQSGDLIVEMDVTQRTS